MRQMLSSLKVATLTLIFSFTLIACSGDFFPKDVQQNVDTKTTDVILENAEVIALGVLQSTFIAHQSSSLYDFLDASDLPNGAVKGASQNCLGGGSAIYNISRDAFDLDGNPSVYKTGDTLSVEYDQCDDGSGSIYNGSLRATYSEIKGLNDTFAEMDVFGCVANLADELSLGPVESLLSEPNFKSLLDDTLNKALDGNLRPVSFQSESLSVNGGSHVDVYFMLGDKIRFKPLADNIEVEALKITEIPIGTTGLSDFVDSVLGSVLISRDDSVIIVNMRSKLSGNQTKMASLGGDQVFSLVKALDVKHSCQRFERTLNATLVDFSTQKGDLITSLNGGVTLSDRSLNFTRHDRAILDSHFFTTVQQGNLISNFEMVNYSILENIDNKTASYSYAFNGDIISDALFGKMSLVNTQVLTGDVSLNAPLSGVFKILGRGLEQVKVSIKPQEELLLDIDFNGDSTGDGNSDFDNGILTSWAELMDRAFKEVGLASN